MLKPYSPFHFITNQANKQETKERRDAEDESKPIINKFLRFLSIVCFRSQERKKRRRRRKRASKCFFPAPNANSSSLAPFFSINMMVVVGERGEEEGISTFTYCMHAQTLNTHDTHSSHSHPFSISIPPPRPRPPRRGRPSPPTNANNLQFHPIPSHHHPLTILIHSFSSSNYQLQQLQLQR